VYGRVATSTIDLDSAGYFDLCKKTKIIATGTSSGLKIWQKCFGGRVSAPSPAGEACSAPQTPRLIWGRKDGKKKRRGRNVRKEGERRDKKEGRGIGGKEEEGPY